MVQESYKERVTGLSDNTVVEGCGITPSAVTHLRLKNTMAKIDKVLKATILAVYSALSWHTWYSGHFFT